nr:hypothetical protein [Tanacetum cinerariifolium]
MVTDPTPSSSTPSSSSLLKPKLDIYAKKNLNDLSVMLYEALKEMLSLVYKGVNKVAKTTVLIYVAKGFLLDKQKTLPDVAKMIAKAIEKEDENLHVEGYEHKFIIELILRRANGNIDLIKEPNYKYPDEFGFGIADDEVLAEEVSQDLLEEMSEEIDKAKLQKAVDEMLRQRCNSGEEHQYHMQQAEIAELRETDRRRQAQLVETLRVMGDMRREMSDIQVELLALRE